jgi:hypothetical protein
MPDSAFAQPLNVWSVGYRLDAAALTAEAQQLVCVNRPGEPFQL